MSDSARLPARPSLEQLQKQAKDLLRLFRAGDPHAAARFRSASPRGAVPDRPALADAQFVIARELGFDTWASLRRQIESIRESGLDQFEQLAKDLAAAYTSADFNAIREINWAFGTSFVHYREPEKMHQRLPNWFASPARTEDLALNDARLMVARSYGFEDWHSFVESIVLPAENTTSAPRAASHSPFYDVNLAENSISVRGPLSDRHWDLVCQVMKENGITRLNAGGITDSGIERIARLDHVTRLYIGNSSRLTDRGLLRVAGMSQLQELDVGGPTGVLTDRGLDVLRHLPELKQFHMTWQQNVSDAGLANLGFCDRLEAVSLMGTPAGDGAIRALAGKPGLRRFTTGRNVTDAGLAILHEFPNFKTWQGGDFHTAATASPPPNHLTLDGPFTNAGIARLVGLDGLFALSFFWHCTAMTAAGLEPLRRLPNLGVLACEGERCTDEAMRHIAALPRLLRLNAQGTVASDAGFEALSRSKSIENIWGRECPNLTGRGFAALAAMPALRALGVSCKNVDDRALATLPGFPSLREFMPMDVPDEGFRHIGRCERLEYLKCMYCRETGDIATAHIAGLPRLTTYYAGSTRITDRSLEILARMPSLESISLWACAGITEAGIALLSTLPRLREITLDGLPAVTRKAVGSFPAHVRVNYSG